MSFGLVNIPVRLYNATSPKDVRFHQFQRGTGKRVRYRRVTEGMHDERRWPEPQDEAAPWTGLEDAAPRIGRPDEEPSPPPGSAGTGPSQSPSLDSEVAYQDIVKGFEIDRDRYVMVSPDELRALEPERSQTMPEAAL